MCLKLLRELRYHSHVCQMADTLYAFEALVSCDGRDAQLSSCNMLDVLQLQQHFMHLTCNPLAVSLVVGQEPINGRRADEYFGIVYSIENLITSYSYYKNIIQSFIRLHAAATHHRYRSFIISALELAHITQQSIRKASTIRSVS